MKHMHWSILTLNWHLKIIEHLKRTLTGNVKYSILDRIHRIGTFCVYPRIILISDGRPTSFTNPASAFVEDSPQYETENVIYILLFKFSINIHIGLLCNFFSFWINFITFWYLHVQTHLVEICIISSLILCNLIMVVTLHLIG